MHTFDVAQYDAVQLDMLRFLFVIQLFMQPVGDFFLNFIGEESVICTRDKTNTFQVFINSCRHRGNAVCRAESGNARSFLCTYHGWTYGLDGKLIGVPGYKDLYHEDLDRDAWGLISAGKVASYKGFIFATMDPEAPDLDERAHVLRPWRTRADRASACLATFCSVSAPMTVWLCMIIRSSMSRTPALAKM